MKRPLSKIIRARRAKARKAAAKGHGFKSYNLKKGAAVIAALAQ